MSVIQGQVQVLDPIGLHARPASQIVKLVKESGLEITIGREGEEFAKANSALRLMALKITSGENLTVEQAVAIGNIDKVVEWSKTSRGGKQFDFMRAQNDGPVCTSIYGLCE
jgi:phosphotransferase system HPr (HPr) family protein